MAAKHVSPGQSTFARDLAIMVGGIIAVAVIVFGGLWLISRLGGDDDPSTTTSPATTAAASQTTTSSIRPTTSSTTEPATTATTAETTTTTAVRDPSEVSVLVLNSVGSPGLAAEATQALRDAGYRTLTPDNYDPQLDQTQVWFTEDFAAEAFDLAAFFPDAEIRRIQEPAPPDADIVVVLGASYEG